MTSLYPELFNFQMGSSILIHLLISFTFAKALPLQRGLGNGSFKGVKLVEDKEQIPLLDDEFEERCAAVRRNCIETGEIFRRNVVCSSNLKRYLNICHLQLRSCDLQREIGEVLAVERCWWINVPEDIVAATTLPPKKTTPHLGQEATTNAIIVDHLSSKWATSTQSPTATISTVDFSNYDSYSYENARDSVF
ncbi:hypothetical protein HOLleu_06407 [Holothuria leucospilota]|uniref:Uncharacterized protein n=1 Tax=Holothuria leucospilota TaxID=206669 RepID=A0A9Q1CLF8_HOLLE|nr:hypothetical protein HOLleu_06407 [Holothuria leucospilota]